MSSKNYKTKTSRYYCTNCNGYFENLKWDGNEAICPKCQSIKWFDLKEEEEFVQVCKRYHKGSSVPSDDNPYP